MITNLTWAEVYKHPQGVFADPLVELKNGRVAGKPLPSHAVGDYKLYTSAGRWLLWVRIRSLQLRTSECLQWMLSQCLRQIAFYICGNPGLCSPGQHLTSIALQRRTPSVSGRGQRRAEPDMRKPSLGGACSRCCAHVFDSL